MNEEKLRQIIREEIPKASKSLVVKDIHLHIHGDDLEVFRLLDKIATLQNLVLERQVLEKINQRTIVIA